MEPEGYFVVQSEGRTVFAGVRLLDADREKAIRELIPGIKTYTWSRNGTGEVMGVRHAGDFKWMAKANTSDKRVEPPFWPGTQWKHALVVSVDQRMPGYDQLDERAAWFYEAVAISKAMLTQTPGVGQRYIAAYKDRDKNWLSGAFTYRLHVPANPPAKGFWSVTAYDEGTRQMPVTEQGRPDISSRKEDIVKNSDGSVDIYFGPKAPQGKEANWVQTNPNKGGSLTSTSTARQSRSSTSHGRSRLGKDRLRWPFRCVACRCLELFNNFEDGRPSR